jgi:hypothetical protein
MFIAGVRLERSDVAHADPSVLISSPTHTRVAENELAQIKRKLRAAAYNAGGLDWKALFHFYDRDNSGVVLPQTRGCSR